MPSCPRASTPPASRPDGTCRIGSTRAPRPRRAPPRFDRHHELAHTLIASQQSLSALDVEREPAARARAIRATPLRPVLPHRPAAGRGGQPFVQVNWSSHVEPARGQRRRRLGHARPLLRRSCRITTAGCSTGAVRPDRRPGRARIARVDAGRRGGRVRPVAEDQRPGGPRAHSQCYTALLAGGGIQGGRAIGASESAPSTPSTAPFSPADLGATILARLGIGAADLTGINLTPDGRAIEELF